MSVPFKIAITKKILEQAKSCGQIKNESIGENCAIAIAVQDLFPEAFVTGNQIHPFGFDQYASVDHSIQLPAIAQDFIKVFDSLAAIPRVRMLLPEFEFVIEISDGLLEQINIEEIQNVGPGTIKTKNASINCETKDKMVPGARHNTLARVTS